MVNKWIGIGRLTKDVEIRYSQDGNTISSFSIACNESWKDKRSGEKKDRVEFVSIVAFNRLAEICGQYLTKGSQVYIEGKIQTRSWEDKDGIKRYTTEINAQTMQMLGSKSESTRRPVEPPVIVPDDEIPF